MEINVETKSDHKVRLSREDVEAAILKYAKEQPGGDAIPDDACPEACINEHHEAKPSLTGFNIEWQTRT